VQNGARKTTTIILFIKNIFNKRFMNLTRVTYFLQVLGIHRD
jgi:hypothetical protein